MVYFYSVFALWITLGIVREVYEIRLLKRTEKEIKSEAINLKNPYGGEDIKACTVLVNKHINAAVQQTNYYLDIGKPGSGKKESYLVKISHL